MGAGLKARGAKVLFIDLDSQTNLTYTMRARTDKAGALEVLTGKASPAETIQNTPQGDIIAGAEMLAGADAILTETGKEYRLQEALTGLKYDYCIIDTPAQLGVLTVNALTAANTAIIPAQADIYSLQGIGQLKSVIESVKKYCNKKLTIDGVLLTRYSPRAVLSRDMQANIKEAAETLQTRLYDTAIRECIAIKEAQANQLNIFEYAPKSNAAQDYNKFIDEFLKGGRNGKKGL